MNVLLYHRIKRNCSVYYDDSDELEDIFDEIISSETGYWYTGSKKVREIDTDSWTKSKILTKMGTTTKFIVQFDFAKNDWTFYEGQKPKGRIMVKVTT